MSPLNQLEDTVTCPDLPVKHLLVSVIIPVRNEAKYIEKLLTSVTEQETPGFDLEVLIIDGMSSDGTPEMVEEMAQNDPRIKLIVNPKQRTPHALNLGIRHARGEYVCIMGAHAEYDRNYIVTCMQELQKTNAVGCGGLVETMPANASVQARLVAWALAHPFGSSTRSFRTRGEGFVDGVNFPLISKQALVDEGGYDEQLLRNQDNDMNQRLRARGHKLYLTGKTGCRYFGRANFASLIRYSFNSGSWNLFSLRRNRAAMGIRHFVPFAFLVSLLVAFAFLLSALVMPPGVRQYLVIPFSLIVGAHLVCGGLAATQIGLRERTSTALLLPFVFLAFHLSYGTGTLFALFQRNRFKTA